MKINSSEKSRHITVPKRPALQVVSCTLEELLNCATNPIQGTSITGQLHTPEYQRPYVWKEKQINQLLNDFIEYDASKIKNKIISSFIVFIILVIKL